MAVIYILFWTSYLRLVKFDFIVISAHIMYRTNKLTRSIQAKIVLSVLEQNKHTLQKFKLFLSVGNFLLHLTNFNYFYCNAHQKFVQDQKSIAVYWYQIRGTCLEQNEITNDILHTLDSFANVIHYTFTNTNMLKYNI